MRTGLAAKGRDPPLALDRGRGDASNSLALPCWHARGTATVQLAKAASKMSETTGMKYAELAKKLKQLGCEYARPGPGSHEIWFNPRIGRAAPIPSLLPHVVVCACFDMTL